MQEIYLQGSQYTLLPFLVIFPSQFEGSKHMTAEHPAPAQVCMSTSRGQYMHCVKRTIWINKALNTLGVWLDELEEELLEDIKPGMIGN